MFNRPHLAVAFAATSMFFLTATASAQQSSTPSPTVTTRTQDRAPGMVQDAGPSNPTAAVAPSAPTTAAPLADPNEASATTTVASPVGASPSAIQNETNAVAAVAEIDERQAGLPHDLSPWGMFMAADLVVKAVMIGLAFASVVTWTVLIAKILELGAVQRSVNKAARALTSAKGLQDAEEIFAGRNNTPARMVQAAREELDRSDSVLDHVSDGGVKERVASRLHRMEVHAGRQIAKGTGLLATIGSTAPFVGLFGTVWGIMNSFIGISKAQTTNLAIVAPGIAEALLATAIGLVAAIPAVVIYNFLARAITGYRHGLTDTSAAIERLVSRDLDARRAKLSGQRPGGTPRPDSTLVRMG